MNGTANTIGKYYRLRSRMWRNIRFLFPSPAETKFVEIMGGYVIHIPFIKHYKTKFPLAYILSFGEVLNNELIKREVRVGKHWVDFGNDLKRGIEVDGEGYHNDIVKQQERDDYFKSYGWSVLHISASELYRNPKQVCNNVARFLID